MRFAAAVGVMALAVMLLPDVSVAATYAKHQVWSPPQTSLPASAPVPGWYAPPAKAAAKRPTAAGYQVPAVDLPYAGNVTAALATSGKAGEKASSVARVGTTPVWVAAVTTGRAAPAKVQVRFVDPAVARKAGFTAGLIFGVARNDASVAAGTVGLQVDPQLLDGEGGGNLAQRLRLSLLPACALTTPNLSACQTRTPVKTSVDPKTGRLDVNVTLAGGTSTPLGAPAAGRIAAASSPESRALAATSTAGAALVSSPMTVMALTAAQAGSTGTYAATSIKPSDQWSAGGSTGDFAYSYPITVPDSLGGAAPTVALSYASSAVDGETVATNSQPSEVGDGWAGMSSFIERSYQPCSQDGISGSGDTCWADGGHQVSISGGNLDGQMVWDDTSKTWHISGNGATIQLVTGGANGAYDGEYWQITEQNGTRLYYGAGKLPTSEGGTGSDVATNSVSTEPVYCPTSGDCDGATSGSASDFTANMPYRWYLDFVVDPHSNATAYNYTQEVNYYARGSAHTDTSYDRDAYLNSISYGWRTSDIASEGAKPAPAAKVVFTEANRCITSIAAPVVTAAECASLTAGNAPYWYDVPYDQVCAATGTCLSAAMSYFSEMRLTTIATYVNTGSTTATAYSPVDSYALVQSFPQNGDGTSPALRLESITRSGEDGGTIPPQPGVSFAYLQLANRVAGAASWPAMDHYRISAVYTETGSVINVTYSNPDCNQSTTNPDLPTPSDDTRLCYEEYWTPPNSSLLGDWFEKYTVSQIEQTDTVGGSPPQYTRYSYPDPPAWHRNDSPLVLNTQRTWDQWRGYDKVIAETGTEPDPVTETETTYLRGMQGDFTNQTGTTTRTWPVIVASNGDTVSDLNQYAGYTLETQTFNQAGGTPVRDAISEPWSVATASHADTATGTPTGVPPEQAYFVEPQTTIARGLMSDNKTWRTTKTVQVYSPTTGLLAQTDSQGDISQLGTASTTETCSTVTYATAPSTETAMDGLPGGSTTVDVSSSTGIGTGTCPAKTAANTVADTLDFYGGSARRRRRTAQCDREHHQDAVAGRMEGDDGGLHHRHERCGLPDRLRRLRPGPVHHQRPRQRRHRRLHPRYRPAAHQ